MSTFVRYIRLLTFAAVMTALATAEASPALIRDASGRLIGADGLLVVGDTYNVRFRSGACQALFDGCDAPSDFQFGEDNFRAEAAAYALISQLFNGRFDTDAAADLGCSRGFCAVVTPYAISSAGLLVNAEILQHCEPGFCSGPGAFGIVRADAVASFAVLSPDLNRFTWADWSLATTAASGVSLPGTMPLAAFALTYMVFLCRRAVPRGLRS